MKTERQKMLRVLTYIFAVIGALGVIYGLLFSALSGGFARTVAAQQDPFLSQRLSQIESRFNTIESRLNRLESDSRLPSIAPRTTDGNDGEIRLLRMQLETLELRLATIECGLVKLDERTTSNAARQARKNSAAPITASERCRLNPSEPLQIIVRGAQ